MDPCLKGAGEGPEVGFRPPGPVVSYALGARWRRASNRITAAATEALSDPTFPRCGIETSWSQDDATRGRSPFPSDPSTSTARPFQSTSVYDFSDSAAAP